MTREEFENIAPRLYPTLRRVELEFFGTDEDADDVAQEAMLRLWRYCERIETGGASGVSRGGDSLKNLAVRVAKNCCVSMHRKRHDELYVRGEATAENSELDISPHEKMEADEVRDTISEVVSRLKPRERSLFEMRQIEGLSNDEISAQTGIPKTSVKAMVSAARRKVFDELKLRLKL